MKVSSHDELQAQISKAPCPGCRKPDLELRLRCDLGLQECLYLIKCRCCGTNYTIEAASETLASDTPLLHEMFSVLACATCGSSATEMGFQCDLNTRGCFYTFTCKPCGRVIKEYR